MNVHELRCLGTLNYNQCEYCFKFFSSTISKSHHRITCKKKPIKRTYQNVIYQKDYWKYCKIQIIKYKNDYLHIIILLQWRYL